MFMWGKRRRDKKTKQAVIRIELQQRAAFLAKRKQQKKEALKFIKKVVLREVGDYIIDAVKHRKHIIELDIRSLVKGYKSISPLSWRSEFYSLVLNQLIMYYPSFKFSAQKDEPTILFVNFERIKIDG